MATVEGAAKAVNDGGGESLAEAEVSGSASAARVPEWSSWGDGLPGGRVHPNPEWNEVGADRITGNWKQLGSSWVSTQGRAFHGFYALDGVNRTEVTRETEAFEVSGAEFPECRRSTGQVIRNKHTGEVVAAIRQGGAWAWSVEMKYSASPDGEKPLDARLLVGAYAAFFRAIGRDSVTLLDGRAAPEVHGTLIPTGDSRIGAIEDALRDGDPVEFYLSFATTAWSEFVEHPAAQTYRMKFWPTFGVEIHPEPHHATTTDAAFLKALKEGAASVTVSNTPRQPAALQPYIGKPFTAEQFLLKP